MTNKMRLAWHGPFTRVIKQKGIMQDGYLHLLLMSHIMKKVF